MGGFGLQYPHINTPLEVEQQQATLGDIASQRQIRQQQVQENTIKLQQMQQAQQDQQNFSNIWRQNNGDMTAALAAAPGSNLRVLRAIEGRGLSLLLTLLEQFRA